VTVDTTATAVSSRKLAQSQSFTFITPTVRLLQTDWYRRGGTYDESVERRGPNARLYRQRWAQTSETPAC
jgi:hypothetical protein